MWRTDSVQAVAFVMPGNTQPDALAIWSALYPGESPDSFQRPSGAPSAVSTAAGPEGASQLTVTSQIGRIDIQRQAQPDPVANEPTALANLEEAVSRAAQQLAQILSIAPVYRVAIVASLIANAETGFGDVMSSVDDGINFPPDALDCVYQFNIRRRSEAKEDLLINRLCTVASGEQNLISFNVGSHGAAMAAGSPMTIRSIPIVNFNIDVNTFTGPGYIITSDEGGLIAEMAAHVLQIAAIGPRALK